MSVMSDLECGILDMPDETILSILRHVHYAGLVRIGQVCRRLHKLTLDDILWRWQCQHYFLNNICTEGQSWHQHFLHLFRNYGKYPHYREIRQAWTKVETFLEKYCPNILQSLQDGVTERELDVTEEAIGHKLPLDVRVSYRIHNGQNLALETAGLMGGGMVSSHIRTDALCPLHTFKNTFMSRGQLLGCVILTQDQVNNSLQVLAVSNRGGYTPGTVYTPLPLDDHRSGTDCFITGASFSDWLCDYADKLEQNAYYTVHEHIFKFYHEPSCVAETAGIVVKPTVCFMPELSRIQTPLYFFAYRIVLEMTKETPADLSCQLTSRHWIITDGDGKEERVNGPGVIGEYPIMRPGEKFDWISCCTFDTPTGNMKGHFKFRNLQTGLISEVECPCYQMEALPSLTAIKREEIVSQLALTEPEHAQENG